MNVIDYNALQEFSLPGLSHRTLAGPHQGLEQCELWSQTIAPGGETPLHRHDCEEVIAILEGSGICECDGKSFAFSSRSTIVVPPNAVHKLINCGDRDLKLLAVLTMAPVRVETPEGVRIPLPWDQD